MTFKLWSETNPEAKKILRPDLALRSWNDLTQEEKGLIWKHLEYYFYNLSKKDNEYGHEDNYLFYGEITEKQNKRKAIYLSIAILNDHNRFKSYARLFLEDNNLNNACKDFFNIFVSKNQDPVFELISIYCRVLSKDDSNCFNDFIKIFNDVAESFALNYFLSEQGFIPRQEKKIIDEIYEPVLKILNDSKWKPVNRDLSDAFKDYQKEDYSGCVTKTISSVQAFLQILVTGQTGKGNIDMLIKQGIKDKKIIDDVFTKQIFDNIESIFARVRQEMSDAHTKNKYAHEKDARLILNLAMVFIQHCLQ